MTGEIDVRKAVAELESVLAEAGARLEAFDETSARRSRAPDKWSRKEILGHLIDSASNNHQRFVRAQLESELRFPPYAQTEWVAAQRYREEPWSSLVSLWRAYNAHLIHVMSAVPPQKYGTPCVIGDGESGTLAWLMADYVRHLKHHLGQIFDS